MISNLQQHINEFATVLSNNSESSNVSFTKKIKPSIKISPELAITIYRNNTRGSRVTSLFTVYPVCVTILGDDVFNAIAKSFVDTDYFGSSDLNLYGNGFEQHLDSILKAGRLPDEYNYLPDLARLEYQVHAAYYADDDPIFDFGLFEHRMKTGFPVYFRVSQSLALLAFQTPVYEIWMNNQQTSDSGASNIQGVTKTQYLLVHREVNKPRVHTINYCEYQLLNAFIDSLSLQNIIDMIDCDVENILPKLISEKWICGVE